MVTVVTGTIGLLVAALIIFLVRRDRLHVTHGMGWIVVAVGFALLGFSPGIIDRLAAVLGIAYPPTLGLILGIVILVIKILSIDIERSHTEVRNQRLIQRVALLEAEMKDLAARLEQDSGAKTAPPDAPSRTGPV